MATAFATLCSERLGPRIVELLGESVTYTPSGSAAQTVNAVVTRDGLQARAEDNSARLEYPVEILISRDDIATVNVHGDTVALKRRVSDSSNSTMRVAALLASEGALWRLGLA
jgi:hypothetical protein